jgi:hypothetical protein
MNGTKGILVFLCLVALISFWSVYDGLGRLPGDIVVEFKSFYLYLPITTAILVSLLMLLIVWLLKRFRG